MRLVGTLKEWLDTKPDAYVSHPKLQESVTVSDFKYHPDGVDCVYPSNSHDGSPMVPFFYKNGFSNYLVSGKVKWIANIMHMFGGTGGSTVIPEDLANDDGWHEVDILGIKVEERSK